MKKVKKIMALCLGCIIAVGISAPAFASGIASSDKNSNVQLYPGEVLVGDTIIGRETVAPANSPRLLRSDCPNYATSKEIFFLYYEGYIQFQPCYKTTSSDGSGLAANRNVKQGWIDYRRNSQSVIDGNVYTTLATSKTDDDIHSASAGAWDSLIPGEEHTTYFYRGWKYFA